jgi:hypothetical protein
MISLSQQTTRNDKARKGQEKGRSCPLKRKEQLLSNCINCHPECSIHVDSGCALAFPGRPKKKWANAAVHMNVEYEM